MVLSYGCWQRAFGGDPATFAVAILLLFAITGLGCMIPARRATQVQPVMALRQH